MGQALVAPAVKRPLDNLRIVAARPKRSLSGVCSSEFSRLFEAVSIKTGAIYEINCRSHRCERHKILWANKWGKTLGYQLQAAAPRSLLLVNLTTAERTSHEVIKQAMELFIARARRYFGPLEYVKIAEMNKLHTQSHYHCIFVFKQYRVPAMPRRFQEENERRRANKEQELSWPPKVFDWIAENWRDALNRYFSTAKETKIVWCQPPKGNPEAAARYAVGYITGEHGGKGEDLDETYRGRKITYSKHFFTTTAADIWQKLLLKWFGPRDPEDLFYWQGRLDPTPRKGDNPEKFRNMPIMVERFALAQFYRRNQTWPTAPPPASPDIITEIAENGQEYLLDNKQV